MTTYERRDGASAQVMDQDAISRAIKRIGHEILERNRDHSGIVLVGIHKRGVPLAERLGKAISDIDGNSIPVGHLDISFYRDDVSLRSPQDISSTEFPVDVAGKTVILVDDVLYTGRTVRAAIDAVVDFGRPDQVQLAVLVDRGHRELPIKADYVGKNIPTRKDDDVVVLLTETDGEDAVEVKAR